MHGRYFKQTHWHVIYKYAFYVCAIWDTKPFSLKNHCCFNTTSYCSDVCGYPQCPQTLAEICRNMCICCGFRAVAAREIYPGFIFLLVYMICWIYLKRYTFYSCWCWNLKTYFSRHNWVDIMSDDKQLTTLATSIPSFMRVAHLAQVSVLRLCVGAEHETSTLSLIT